jgi:chromosome segregation ATPase
MQNLQGRSADLRGQRGRLAAEIEEAHAAAADAVAAERAALVRLQRCKQQYDALRVQKDDLVGELQAVMEATAAVKQQLRDQQPPA